VLLFFSMQGSGAFQGVARIANVSSKDPKLDWEIPSNLTEEALCHVYKLDWISQ